MNAIYEENLKYLHEYHPQVALTLSQLSEPSTSGLTQHTYGWDLHIQPDNLPLHGPSSSQKGQPWAWDENAICLGLGLGNEWFSARVPVDTYASALIIEPQYEFFQLSLALYDWRKYLSNARVKLAIGTTPENLAEEAATFWGQTIHFAPRFINSPVGHPSHPHWHRYKQSIQLALQTQSNHFSSSISKQHTHLKNPLHHLDPYHSHAHISSLSKCCTGEPGILIGASPSLANDIETLRANQDRARLVAVSTAMQPLLHAGIIPHVVTCLDYHERSLTYLDILANLPTENLPLLVLDPQGHPDAAKRYPGPKMYITHPVCETLMQRPISWKNTIEPGTSVAQNAFRILQFMGCDPIAIVGVDLAYVNGVYHTPGTANYDNCAANINSFSTFENIENDQLCRFKPIRVTLTSGEKHITTDQLMLTYRTQFDSMIEHASQKIYVCSNYGIHFNGSTNLSLGAFYQSHGLTTLPPMPRLDENTRSYSLSSSDKLNQECQSVFQNAISICHRLKSGEATQETMTSLDQCHKWRQKLEQTDWMQYVLKPMIRSTQVKCMKMRRHWQAIRPNMSEQDSFFAQIACDEAFWQGCLEASMTIEENFRIEQNKTT